MQNQVDALLRLQGLTDSERDLLDAAVEAYYSTGAETANETFRVELESGTVAYHKPVTGVDAGTAGSYGHDPDETIIHEAAAWQLARLLGPPVSDLVAPCVLRTVEGEPGALSREALGDEFTDAPMTDAPDQAMAAALFDALVAQQDRHMGNLRYDADSGTLSLIDHGYAFACSGDLLNWSAFVAWRHREGEDALHEWERDALERLVASDALLGLRDALAPARAALLEARAQTMIVTGRILDPGEF